MKKNLLNTSLFYKEFSLIIICLVIILGAFLRFYDLGQIPHGFHRDEAFLGYNAYSLFKTGKDMNGIVMPLHLQSFLFSPAGYSYFSIPFIFIFGLSEFSVRFASAFFGTGSLILVYLFCRLFLKDVRNNKEISIVATFFAAISPWHINLSRTATENTIVVFFILLGTILSLFWIQKGKFFFLILGFLSFFVTLFIYQAPRAFLPFFIPLILFSHAKIEEIKKKKILLCLLFFLLIILPIIFILQSKELSLRIRTVSMFSDQHTQLVLDEQLRDDGVTHITGLQSRIFHNKVMEYTKLFFENYFLHFTYSFLFTDKGLPDRYRVPGMGLLYLFDIPLLTAGVITLLRNRSREATLIFGWTIISFVGCALTFDDIPNLQRSLILFPMYPLISAIGFVAVVSFFQRKMIRILFISFFSIVVIFFMAYYLHQYYIHVDRYRPWYRNDGYKELVTKVNKLLPQYKKAIITNRESSPTIFFLLYSLYSPQSFQNEIKQSPMHDLDRIAFGRYQFSEEECPLRTDITPLNETITGDKGILYVNSGLCREDKNVNTIATIKRGDGSAAFRIVERK